MSGGLSTMKKTDIEKECPLCHKKENQVKMGHNRSGTQRCMCKECGISYTIDPKKHEYSEETRQQAIKMHKEGISGREIGRILGINKANVYNWIKKYTAHEKSRH